MGDMNLKTTDFIHFRYLYSLKYMDMCDSIVNKNNAYTLKRFDMLEFYFKNFEIIKLLFYGQVIFVL